MPTGYTAGVRDGTVTDFNDFARRCSGAFGARFHQRDDSMDAPFKLQEVSDYKLDWYKRDEERLLEAEAMTLEEAEQGAQEAWEKSLKHYQDSEQRRLEERNRYDAMIAKVKAWEPPTEDHVNLKEFMLNQLEESKEFDTAPHEWNKPKQRETAAEYKAREMASAAASFKRSAEALAEERKRVREANAWITVLADSLGVEVHA